MLCQSRFHRFIQVVERLIKQIRASDCLTVTRICLLTVIAALDGRLICGTCKLKLDKNQVPSIAICNKMNVSKRIEVVKMIGMIFCKLVHCFQTVIKTRPSF